MSRLLYFIAMQNRVGSTWLCELLNSTGVAGEAWEVFHEPREDQEAYWESLRDRDIGVKLSWPQLTSWFPFIDCDLSEARWVWLRRRDLWAVAVSQYRAEQSGLWTVWRERNPGAEVGPVEFNTEAICQRYLDARHNEGVWDAFFSGEAIKPLEIWYEDLVERPVELTYLVLGHLKRYYAGPVDTGRTRKLRTPETVEWARLLREKYGD